MDIRIGGIVFLDWQIVREIGRGASGTVYEIRKENQGAALTAALKVLQIGGDPADGSGESLHKLVDELVGEIKLMISLKESAYVVKCEDFAVESSPAGDRWTVAIRMEMLEPVASYCRGHGLTEADVHRMAVHMAKALALLEERGIIHRDIKPENIFVSPFGDFKLGDFGIAQARSQAAASISQEGTQSYMAPEVFHCQEYDHTADIYSLGLVLYRYLNRDRLPFQPMEGTVGPIDRQGALAERLSGKKELGPPVCASEGFGRVILKMCAYRPEDRYANAALLLRDLEAVRPASAVVLPAGGAGAGTPAPQEAEEDLTAGYTPYWSQGPAPVSTARWPVRHAPERLSPEEGWLETPSDGPSGARMRKAREYKPSAAEDAGSGGKKKKAGGKKKLLLAAALVAVVVAAAVPAVMSLESALVVKDGSGSGSANIAPGIFSQVDAEYGNGENVAGSLTVTGGTQRPEAIPPEAEDVVLLDIEWTGKKEQAGPVYLTVSDPRFTDGGGLAVYEYNGTAGQWDLLGSYLIQDNSVTFLAAAVGSFAFQVIQGQYPDAGGGYPPDGVIQAIETSGLEIKPGGGEYVAVPTSATVNAGSAVLRLRTGPATGYKLVASMPDETVVDVYANKEGWSLVYYEDAAGGPVYGWCNSEYLLISSGAATPWPGPVVPEQAQAMGPEYFADAAFLGNSVTSGLWYYDTQKLLPSDTSHWYWADSLTIFGASDYVARMPANTFGKVYIGFGVNELSYGEQTLRDSFNAVIDQVQAAQPDAIVYIMSVTPVSAWCDANRPFKRSAVLAFNEMLQDIARQQQVWYLDVYPVLCGPDGYLPSDVTPDGVHFSSDHYQYWFNYMKTHYVPDGTPPAPTASPEPAQPAANG